MEERAVALVCQHLEIYPQMRIADVYKLLYQACMGAEHAITDEESVEHWLLEEWETFGEGSVECPREGQEEDLYEDLSLHTPIYRINLRPAKAKAVKPSLILEEFIRLGNGYPKNELVLTSTWEVISRKIRSGIIFLPDPEGIDEFNELVCENRFPPIHHSKEYSEAYRPAYRLVGRPFD